TFGEAFAEIFFFPYNRKVWGYPLERLGVSWMGERVAVPDLERLRRNVRTGREDVSWGPNNMFRFPRHGGTGAIWQGVAALLPAEKVLRAETLRDETHAAMRRDGLLGGAEVVSFWHRREAHGYPTPFLGRDETLAAILPALEACRVYSRGRFGAWKYEVSNQDHSCMQGVELVDRLLGVGEGDEP